MLKDIRSLLDQGLLGELTPDSVYTPSRAYMCCGCDGQRALFGSERRDWAHDIHRPADLEAARD